MEIKYINKIANCRRKIFLLFLIKVLLFLKFYQYKDIRYLKTKKEFRSKLNDCKEIKHYIKNNELDLEKIINEYSSYTATIINNMARDSLNNEDKE